ncbi:VOC family protein [Paenibacillus psychroresistens]|uniref:VOC family protein n=1 Tax=Paenibacillus psychroresistens TaxID=1778678 RepID=A0A6B8RPH1_9BACL|nr:VOC family protein [Paenibacillus psychroresistens]QGQ97276.1 VOC family protein [Paenibacillus psychroresistens]
MENSNSKITTFLMFEGKAEEAMKLYTSIFDQSEIISIQRYGANQAGAEGSVLQATFSLHGQVFMCIDSSVKHGFTFTPAISLYVTCDTEAEIDRVFAQLSEDGKVLMALDSYPFSKRFGWLQDKFGVSWQLNLNNGNNID